MSIAFQALVLLALALPGIIFRRAYSRSGQFREKIPVADELVKGLIVAVLLQAIWVALFALISLGANTRVRLDDTLMLTLGQFGEKSAYLDRVIQDVTTFPSSLYILIYFITLYLFASISGARCRSTAKHLRSLENPGWFQRCLLWLDSLNDDGPNWRRWDEWTAHLNPEDPMEEVRILSAVVPLGGASYLYYGVLEKDGVVFDDTGAPDRFILRGANRRKIGDAEGDGKKEKYYPIRGAHLIIRMSEIKTLNLSWLGFPIDEVEEHEPAPPEFGEGDGI